MFFFPGRSFGSNPGFGALLSLHFSLVLSLIAFCYDLSPPPFFFLGWRTHDVTSLAFLRPFILVCPSTHPTSVHPDLFLHVSLSFRVGRYFFGSFFPLFLFCPKEKAGPALGHHRFCLFDVFVVAGFWCSVLVFPYFFPFFFPRVGPTSPLLFGRTHGFAPTGLSFPHSSTDFLCCWPFGVFQSRAPQSFLVFCISPPSFFCRT